MRHSPDTLDSRRRRTLLKGMVGLSALGLMPRLMQPAAYAQARGGYRALVCIFLYGGNDSNNMVVPFATTANNSYAAYAAVRGAQATGGLALTQASLLPLVDGSGDATFAFHPAMTGLAGLFSSANLAILNNVGTLVAPVTATQYQAKSVPVPENLFSHLDQQREQAASALPELTITTGWGGRMIDALGQGVGGAAPPGITLAGNSLFLTGASTAPVALPQSGTLNLGGLTASGAGLARQTAFTQLAAANPQSLLVTSYGGEQTAALNLAGVLNPVLASTATSASAFSGLTSSLSKQLAQIAKIIEHQALLGNPTRQLFFASLGSFDTHADQIDRQGALLTDLSASMSAFYDATQLLGMQNNVTTFTLSDFTRTYKPASDGGTDHAWGGHHLIMGGAVKGQQSYGTFPTLALGGPDDVSDQGRWIPTTSIDQYAATLGKWFGISAAQLQTVLPNLHNFSTTDLGFLNT